MTNALFVSIALTSSLGLGVIVDRYLFQQPIVTLIFVACVVPFSVRRTWSRFWNERQDYLAISFLSVILILVSLILTTESFRKCAEVVLNTFPIVIIRWVAILQSVLAALCIGWAVCLRGRGK